MYNVSTKNNLVVAFLLGSATQIFCTTPTSQEVFTAIYEKGVWGTPWFSGGGSLIEHNKSYVDFLQKFLKDYKIRSVVDIGCGDWLLSRHINWNNIHYFGYEVVQELINRNQKAFGSETISFAYGDALNDQFPPADLMICRDVLQHLSNEDVLLFLRKQTKRYKYCLITNCVDPQTLSSTNPDIERGDARPLDITKPPFSWPGTKIHSYRSRANSVKTIILLTNNE